jgi:hypothetical protein
MGSRAGAKTPGKALKDILNTGTPFAVTAGKRSKHEDRTVDVGALLRGSLVVPKLRCQEQQQQAQGPKPSPLMQPNPIYSPSAESPDGSLQQAASKLAHLKASRMAVQTTARPAGREALAATQAADLPRAAQDPGQLPAPIAQPPQQSEPPNARPQQRPASPGSTSPQRQPGIEAAARGTPEYQPDDWVGSGDDAVPLAARTAITKRHRRKSQHHGPERFGEWFSGDDDQLECALQEYNLSQQQEQQVRAGRQARGVCSI